jgi:hypothetical protein
VVISGEARPDVSILVYLAASAAISLFPYQAKERRRTVDAIFRVKQVARCITCGTVCALRAGQLWMFAETL